MSLTKETMKGYLLRDKIFLKRLYTSEPQQAKKIITAANDSEIDTLLRYLHFLRETCMQSFNLKCSTLSRYNAKGC